MPLASAVTTTRVDAGMASAGQRSFSGRPRTCSTANLSSSMAAQFSPRSCTRPPCRPRLVARRQPGLLAPSEPPRTRQSRALASRRNDRATSGSVPRLARQQDPRRWPSAEHRCDAPGPSFRGFGLADLPRPARRSGCTRRRCERRWLFDTWLNLRHSPGNALSRVAHRHPRAVLLRSTKQLSLRRRQERQGRLGPARNGLRFARAGSLWDGSDPRAGVEAAGRHGFVGASVRPAAVACRNTIPGSRADEVVPPGGGKIPSAAVRSALKSPSTCDGNSLDDLPVLEEP